MIPQMDERIFLLLARLEVGGEKVRHGYVYS
jgi:hypothetical protein